MAKLAKHLNKKPIKTTFDGIYVRNLPAKAMEKQFGGIQERIETEQQAVIEELFNNLVCDEDGEAFEDCTTFDEITDVMSLKDIQEIMQAVAVAINPAAADAGK